MIPYKFNPLGISRSSKEYFSFLTFTAIQDNSSVTLTQIGTLNTINLYYKTSSSNVWNPYTINTEIPLSQGQYVQFWNKNSLFSKDLNNYFRFVMTGKIAGSGNVQSLLNFSENAPAYCFLYLFYNCSSLITAPELPATSIYTRCYEGMFQNCTSLVTAPKLSVTTLAENCYQQMFYGCTSLVTAPELPATTLVMSCYLGMFQNCTSLVTAPELLATTLASSCYREMFRGCTSLTTPPKLPATTLASECYYGMFWGCTSLITAPTLPATTLSDTCYTYMLYYCKALKTAPTLPATTLAHGCYGNMFTGCETLIEAPELPATTLASYCYQGMFANCNALTKAPKLPATILFNRCYLNMFLDCSKLSEIDVSFTEWNDSINATGNWVTNVAISGDFYCNSELVIPMRGNNYIPSGWNVIPKDVILGQIIEENGVKKFAELSFDGPLATIDRIETFDNVYSFNKISNLPYKKRLNYIESTGTQYITTDYLFDAKNKGSELEIKFYLPAQSVSVNDSHFGARGPASNALYSNLTHIRVGEGNSGQSYFSIITREQEHVFTFRNGIFSVDGVETDTGMFPSLEYEFDLFTFNAAGNHTTYIAPSGTRIYYCKFYENGVLVQHLIPVLDKNGVPCMYDTVSDTYYYNAGTGTFNYGDIESEDIIELGQIIDDNGTQKFASLEFNDTTPILKEIKTYTNVYEYNKISNLPYKKRLNYIESTGTQYIDTGVKPDYANGDKIEIRYYMAEMERFKVPFGSRTTGLRNGLTVQNDNRPGLSPLILVVYTSDAFYSYPLFSTGMTKYWDEDVEVVIENSSITISSIHYNMTYDFNKSVTSEFSVYLFAINHGNSIYADSGIYSGMRLYDWKYYHNGVLAQYLIPVLDQNDVPCLYDTVSGTFFYNAGTGTFNYGEI